MPSATSKTKQKHSWQFNAIGTSWSIETTEPLANGLKKRIQMHIDSFDATYSRFRDDSIIDSMAEKAGTFELPSDGRMLGEFYKKLYDATDGALSPLVGSSLNAAGYDKDYSFKAEEPKIAPKWEDVMTWQGSSVVTRRPVEVDIGAAGKGLLVDELSEIIEQAGMDEYAVDASGDVRIRGIAQRIGLENPHDPTMVIGAVEITNESLCASATNRRKWGNDWHHVLDARSGMPVNDVVATWVIAESTMAADGLATALFFVPAKKLQDIASFDYVRLLHDGTVEYSKRFVGQLFV